MCHSEQTPSSRVMMMVVVVVVVVNAQALGGIPFTF
jgi:hypothetical protein